MNNIYTINNLAIWDSFAGMIKCVVINIPDSEHIIIKITSRNNNIYKQGELITTLQSRVYPRNCWRRTGIFSISVNDYKWSK